MATYYVHKGVGADGNSGTSWANAWASLGKAQAVAGAGDTVYVRAGATPYYEALRIDNNSQQWLADPGHQPILDGKYHDGLSDLSLIDKPAGTYVVQKNAKNHFPAMVGMSANDCVLDGFFVRNVAGRGIAITGNRNTVRNCRVDFTYTNGIIINNTTQGETCNDNLVEGCEISRASVAVYANKDQGKSAWGTPYDVSCAAKNGDRATFRNVLLHHCHAEGIVLGAGTNWGTIDRCGSWNNEHMCYYVNNAMNATVKNSWAFSTAHPEMLRKGKHASEPLVVTEEINASQGEVTNAKIYNNIFVGGRWTLTLARIGYKDGKLNQETRLKNCYFGFNTIVGLEGVTQAVLEGGTAHPGENSVFENNVIYVPPGSDLKNRFSDPMTGLKGRGNVIFKPGGVGAIPNWMNGPGTIIADPKLFNPTAAIIDNGGSLDDPPDGGNNFNVNNYKLTGSSPAIGNATVDYPFNGHAGVEQARTGDHFGATRVDPDIGAHEYGGAVTNSVTASFTRSPSATTLVEGATVVFTNTSLATGTANITGQTWTAKRAGTTVNTATTEHYQYTFATAGNYTVELAVTATGGLSDTEIVAYTVTTGGGGVVVTAAFNASPSQTTVQEGTTVTFTDQSTVQNGTLASRAWAVLALPGLTTEATGSGATFGHLFDTAGSWRVRLTATAATGQSDVEERDYTVTEPPVTVTVTAAFTSDDADGIIEPGTEVTFTNTSSVSGTTITGYAWSVGGVTGALLSGEYFTTEDLAFTFNEPGAYTVTLRVDTAADLSDQTQVTIIVLGQATAGMDVMVVPWGVNAATATGTQIVTAPELGTKVPVGAWVRLAPSTTFGTAVAGAMWSEGAASASAQWVHCRFSADSEATTKAWRRYSTAALLMTIDDAGAVTGEASFVRFVPGGMEIDVTTAFSDDYWVDVVFFAGDEAEFWAGSVAPGAQDVGTDVITGFEPSVVYMASSWAAAEGAASTHAELSRGFAIADGTQMHYRNRDDHGAAASNLVTRLQQTGIGTSAEGSAGYCKVEATDFSAGGFRLVPRSGNLIRSAGLWAFRAGGYGVSLSPIALPTADPLEVALPFEAQTVLALTGTFYSQTLGQLGGADAEGQGWCSHSIHTDDGRSGSIASDNGAATSATRSRSTARFNAVAPDGTLFWDGVATLDADGFSVAWLTTPAQPYRVILLAIETGVILDAPGDEPVADFTVIVEPDDDLDGRVTAYFDGSISNGNGETIDAYAWAFGDGETSAEAAPLHVYEQPGVYTVTLTVTTVAGSDTKTLTLPIADLRPIEAPVLVGPIDPATSGGDTENAVDEETVTHTHEIAGALLKLREMVDSEYADFVAAEADPVYTLVALYGGQLVFKFPNGTTGTVTIT